MSKVVTSASRLSDIFLSAKYWTLVLTFIFLDTLWKLFYNH